VGILKLESDSKDREIRDFKTELSTKETEIKKLKSDLEDCQALINKNEEEDRRGEEKLDEIKEELQNEKDEHQRTADDNFGLTHHLEEEKEKVKKLAAQLKAKELIHAEELKKMITNTKADIQHWEQLADQKNTVTHFPFLLTLAFSLTLEENSRLKV
jgi:chromosome segregation ATPase